MRLTALVLAAGTSRRFGSPKLLAPIAGRPVLEHTLRAVAASGIRDVIVVLGDEAPAIEAAVVWRDERRIINPRPADGLSGSLRLGLDAAAEDPDVEAVLVVLGDQPSLRADVIEAVVGAARSTRLPFVRPRYADDAAANPVLVRRGAWPIAAGMRGDRGLGPLFAKRPDLVAEVAVGGSIPDVDTPADLVRLAERWVSDAEDARDAAR